MRPFIPLGACAALALATLLGCNPLDYGGTSGLTVRPRETEPVRAGPLEVVHEFNGPMPTGVAVSHDGRIFVNYPRWEDPVQFTVAEIRDGQEVPFPSAEANAGDTPDSLFSVQSVVVDPRNRLWALDTGSENMGPIKGIDWPKLVCIDLDTNQVIKTIRFPAGVIHEKTYLNDVRFDLRRNDAGMAFITDSSSDGPNGIIVVDLATGRSWRKLNDHPSTRADVTFQPVVEGERLLLRKPGEPSMPVMVGSDGIAIRHDGSRLIYCPLSSRRLHSVSTDALADPGMPDEQVAKTVNGEERDFASDGLESDAEGRLYLTDWENNAIRVRLGENDYQTIAQGPRLLWPDTLALATNGYLYVTANQLHRQAKFHDGEDRRQRPFYLFRLKVDADPVMLRPQVTVEVPTTAPADTQPAYDVGADEPATGESTTDAPDVTQ